jgi:hypothetical protein
LKNYQSRYYSAFDIFLSLLYRVLLIGAIIYLGSNYNENPTLILFLIIACTFLFLIIGSDTYYINQYILTIKDDSILSIIFRRKKTYDLSSIIKIELQQFSNNASESLIYSIGRSVLNLKRHRFYEVLFLTLNNNKVVRINCYLSLDYINEIIEKVNNK